MLKTAIVTFIVVLLLMCAYLVHQHNLSQPFVPTPVAPLVPLPSNKKEITYEGVWSTVGQRKSRFNGTMTCVVTPVVDNKWMGKFFGVWQGKPFSYVVDFAGPSSKLYGKAIIDHADYDWQGEILNGSFGGTFTSSRYEGNFKLIEKTEQ